MSRETADIICRALLAIVAALRKQYNLPMYQNIVITVTNADHENVTPPPVYKTVV